MRDPASIQRGWKVAAALAVVAALCLFVAAMLDPGPLLLVLAVVCLGLGKAFAEQAAKPGQKTPGPRGPSRSEDGNGPLSSTSSEDAS